ncbi:MAG: hypothetical protein JXK93_03080 [Sphaerochaetaceae bacterium]|nr:hypothetical protein [Sphaerochaetaceae bacterium]
MNILGLILSYVYVAVLLVIGFSMAKREFIPSEVVRKFIHIMVSNWWFLLLFFFDSFAWAIAGPISFTIMNGAAVVTGVAKQLGERTVRRNLGLVYFPISLGVVVYLVYHGHLPMWAATIGIFTMGYGDGLAALIGRLYGKRKLIMGKSLLGSSVMFITTFIVILLVSAGFSIAPLASVSFLTMAIALAFLVTIVELLTPASLDNLTVPIIASYLAYLLLGSL